MWKTRFTARKKRDNKDNKIKIAFLLLTFRQKCGYNIRCRFVGRGKYGVSAKPENVYELSGGQKNAQNLSTQKAPQKNGARFPQENGGRQRQKSP